MTDSPIDMLFDAARSGDEAALVLALRHALPASIDIEDADGRTPLMRATEYGHARIMKILVRRGANIDHRDHDGNTTLMMAAEWGAAKAVDDLLALGSNPNVVNDNRHTALMFATTTNQIHIARTLLEKGANPLLLNSSGSAAIHIAADWNSIDFLALFHEHKVDINLPDGRGMTPLMRAALCGAETGARYLLSVGGDPSRTDNARKTALQHASTPALREMIAAACDNDALSERMAGWRDMQESLRPYRKLRKPTPTM